MAFALLAVLGFALPPAAPAEHSATELLSTGPGPDGGVFGAFDLYSSPDGRRVLFGTDSALVPEDSDNCDQPEFEDFRRCIDAYERFGGTTSLLTTGPADQHRLADIRLEAASGDRTRAFFNTSEPLVAEDTDTAIDVYERTAGTTTLLSVGPAGQNGSASLQGVSHDGTRAFFLTSNALVPEDADQCIDLYERSAGTTKLVSTGIPPVPTHIHGCTTLIWAGSSADGSRVFLTTNAPVTSDDGDDGHDIFQWHDGQATLISNGPGRRGDGGFIDDRVIVSRDGTRLFFRTSKQLVPEDTEDGRSNPADYDLYEHVGGTTRLVVPPVPGDSSPPGGFSGMSEDGSRVFFQTRASLVPEDTNGLGDLYERVSGEYRLVTTGPLGNPGDAFRAGGFPAPDGTLMGISANGRAVVFASSNRFTPEDTDNVQDVYLRANGETRLVSTGPGDTHEDVPVRSDLVILTPDGSRVFTTTAARFVAEDTDSLIDVYEWRDGQTTLVPDGVPTTDHIALMVSANAIVRDGSRVFIATNARLTADDTNDRSDLYAVDLPNQPPRCDSVSPSLSVLSPANGRLVRIALSGATDLDGDDVSIEVTAVTQDEPTGRSRDAVSSPDGDEVRLRAERDNREDGRVYRVEFDASDGKGGSCSGTATVSVPRKKNKAAVDSAPPSYDSFG